jgi:DNA topoisomerase-1
LGTDRNTKNGSKALVIVESPAKAKTINKYLGANYVVKASMGHVRDLPKSGIGVDIDADFAPTYEILPTRKKLISELKSEAKKSGSVFLATDLDREGEAIAWHLCHALGLTPERAQRVVFNEITPGAIRRAFENPRKIDQSKVNAQQARRILDRLVGYKVSPLLWKKVARDLSAGRVQSVAVKLIVDREREIQAFIPEEFWKIQAVFTTDLKSASELRDAWERFTALPDDEEDADDGTDSPSPRTAPNESARRDWMSENRSFKAELVEFNGKKFDPKTAREAVDAAAVLGLTGITHETSPNDGTNGPRGIPARGPAETITKVSGNLPPVGKPPFVVRSVTSKPSTSRPPGPFSTSTLQQAASNQLGFAAQRTMRIAQQLYEGVEIAGQGAVGLITYMRTDSQNISADALSAVRKFIGQQFPPAYLPSSPNFYASRQGAQEAHEAIRPTDVELTPERVRHSLSEEQFKLYELIWKRFVACQMAPAQWRITEALIICQTGAATPPVFKATGRQLEFDGFTRVAGINSRFGEQVLPPLAEKQAVVPLDIHPSQHFTSPPPRYTEATLVKALESEGIGRPSTYASIIGTIRDRHYVDQVSPRDRRFCATDLGMKVTDKLVEGFPDLMELGFTRRVEGELDQIEEAGQDWVNVVRSFYEPLARDLATAEERMTHARAEATPSPYKCPKCGAPMVYKLAKRGKTFLSCSRYPDCDGGSSVDREGKPVEVELTPYKCPTCGKPMIKRAGRFGPFFGCSGYPECKTIQAADRNTGEPLPPKPPPRPTGLTCPRCNKKELVIRSGKRGEFISCSGYPRCRMTLPAERLAEFQALAKENKWPPPDIFEKAAKIGSKAVKTSETPAQSTSGGSPSAAPTGRKRRSAKAGA